MLDRLLRQPWAVRTCGTFDEWWIESAATREAWQQTVPRAIALGFRADRLAWAFGGGYSSAMIVLDPGLREEPGALCATEEGGAHPRAIAARLEAGRVTGTKHFVSFGSSARTLLVVASEGVLDGRNRLRVVRIAANAPGVHVTTGVELPFIPEVPHASVRLDAAAGEVLEGDGYDDFLKPFRTIEDLHVTAAVTAWLTSVALRKGWSQAFIEEALLLLSGCLGLGGAEVRAPVTHLALAGALARLGALAEKAEWADDADAARFMRDRALLRVASKAREARRVAAWQQLS